MIKDVFMLIEESPGLEELLEIFVNRELAVSWAKALTKQYPDKNFSLRQRGVQMLLPPICVEDKEKGSEENPGA